MAELFRLKITSRNDVVMPARLKSRLQLREGDELQIEVSDDDSLSIEKVSAGKIPISEKERVEDLKRRASSPGSRDLASQFLSDVRSNSMSRAASVEC